MGRRRHRGDGAWCPRRHPPGWLDRGAWALARRRGDLVGARGGEAERDFQIRGAAWLVGHGEQGGKWRYLVGGSGGELVVGWIRKDPDVDGGKSGSGGWEDGTSLLKFRVGLYIYIKWIRLGATSSLRS